MLPRVGPNRIKAFWPNVGSIAEYPKSLVRILSHINQANPSRRDAVLWVCREYRVVHEFARKLLNVLRAAGAMHCERSAYSLSAEGQNFLESGDSDILFRLFLRSVAGFKEMIQLLETEAPLPLKALDERWAETMRPVRFAPNQGPIRYNWLRGFGYASVVAHHILLTEKGLKLATELRLENAETSRGRTGLSHVELEDKVRLIGEFFEFEAKKRPSINDALPSYALKLREGDRQLDCLWVRYIPFAGQIRFPVEIQLGGNLADSLDRLETVCDHVQRAIIVTTEDQEQKIVDRLKVKRSHLLDKLTIIFVDDVYKAVEAAGVLTALARKIFTG